MTEDNDKLFNNNEYPTLHIKNFAKIEEANIELAPFTLFVGDNNSGKSYLLSLIWGIKTHVLTRRSMKEIRDSHAHGLENLNSMTLRRETENVIKSDLYEKCLSQCSKYLPKKIEEYNLDNLNSGDIIEEIKIDKEFIYNIFRLYSEMLNTYKDNIIDYVFDNKNIKIKHLSISIPKNLDVGGSISHYTGSEFNEILSTISLSVNLNGSSIQSASRVLSKLLNEESLLELIMSQCLNLVVFHSMKSIKDELFFPASRTGFVLLNRDIQSRALDSLFDSNNIFGNGMLDYGLLDNNMLGSVAKARYNSNSKTLKLTKPVENFYRRLAGLDSDNLKNNKISDFIEKNIIHGSVKLNDMSTPEIRYSPDNFEDDFPMKVTSAVVTELVPLVLFLKDKNGNQNIMFEEPEISLHPRLQQKITRVFIKLVNSGRQVFITTHSDTIVQHINNMIKLANNKPERQKVILDKFKYDKDDIIHQNKIRMYQFDVDENTQRTTIRDLAASEYGFEVPTFNDFLDDISDEIDILLEKMPDETKS